MSSSAPPTHKNLSFRKSTGIADTMSSIHRGSSHLSSNGTSTAGSTFFDWNSSQVQILFTGWETENSWQFALTWFVVVLATMSLHYFECAYLSMKSSMVQVLTKYSAELAEADAVGVMVLEEPTGRVARATRPLGWQVTKLCMGLLSGMRYAMTLFLMLIAMTYNPSLFVALVFGYFLGDFVCSDFHVNMRMGVDNTPGGGKMGPLIRSLLCIKDMQLEDDIIPLIQQIDVFTSDLSVGLE